TTASLFPYTTLFRSRRLLHVATRPAGAVRAALDGATGGARAMGTHQGGLRGRRALGPHDRRRAARRPSARALAIVASASTQVAEIGRASCRERASSA